MRAVRSTPNTPMVRYSPSCRSMACGKFFVHRHDRLSAIIGFPPVARGQRVARRQFGRIGQATLSAQGPCAVGYFFQFGDADHRVARAIGQDRAAQGRARCGWSRRAAARDQWRGMHPPVRAERRARNSPALRRGRGFRCCRRCCSEWRRAARMPTVRSPARSPTRRSARRGGANWPARCETADCAGAGSLAAAFANCR